jgi:hypothetical protein
VAGIQGVGQRGDHFRGQPAAGLDEAVRFRTGHGDGRLAAEGAPGAWKVPTGRQTGVGQRDRCDHDQAQRPLRVGDLRSRALPTNERLAQGVDHLADLGGQVVEGVGARVSWRVPMLARSTPC